MQQMIVVGYLGKDPETHYHQSGTASTSFSVAVTETWKDRNSGEKKERTEWFYCEAWGKTAEIAAEFLQKGSQVQLIGTLRTDKWTTDQGEERRMTKLRIRDMMFLNNIRESRRSSNGGGQQQQQQTQTANQPPQDDFDDDIPF